MDAQYSKFEQSDLSALSDNSSDEGESFFANEDVAITTRVKSVRQTRIAYVHWMFHLLALTCTVFLALEGGRRREMDRTQCWDLFNWWSPVNDGVAPFKFVEQRFNGSLWYKSAFKGPPSPQEEQAWSDATKYGMFALSDDDLSKLHELGQSPDVSSQRSARFPPELGGGYIATTVGAHQLHCLHNLWMDHHINKFPEMEQKLKDVPEMYELHYEHCVDFIRQSLMCHYDTGIITYNWVRDLQKPTPNANVPHRCVDLGPLNDWLAHRVIQTPSGYSWSQPPDAYVMEHHPA